MSEIRQYFVSRFPNGYIAEYDFSQLEIIALAHLTQDKNLISDIKSGLDMHVVNASLLYNMHYDTIKSAIDQGDKGWKAKRKAAKGPGFLIQYGGGASTMSKNTGLSVKQCKGFIDNYYSRYPQVKRWQQLVAEEVSESRQLVGNKRTVKGLPAGTGTFISETGRHYKFLEFDDFRDGASFSPTQMKNYAIQGFATGDIVPMILGKLFRELKKDRLLRNNCLMINTVHDSVVFDVRDEGILDVANVTILRIMQNAPKYLKEKFNIDFDLRLPVDGEAGRDWMTMEPVDRIVVPF